jgi:hypothetical protein
MSIQNADAEFMQPILDRYAEQERQKPRIACPKHGTQLACDMCGKCIECDRANTKAENLAHCKRERHTFLNLSAPCNWCRTERGYGIMVTHNRSVCGWYNYWGKSKSS